MNWFESLGQIDKLSEIKIDKTTSVSVIEYSGLKSRLGDIPMTQVTIQIDEPSDNLLKRMKQYLKVVEWLNKQKEVSNISLSIDGKSDRCLFGECNEWQYLNGYITFEIYGG